MDPSARVHPRGEEDEIGASLLAPHNEAGANAELRALGIPLIRIVGRHSDSLDVERFRCGACSGRFVPLGAFSRDGTPARRRKPSACVGRGGYA